MSKKIEQARNEFNDILDYVVFHACEQEIHKVEESLFKMLLRLGRIFLELFIDSLGTGEIGTTLVKTDVGSYRYAGLSPRSYLSVFGEITIHRAHYARQGSAGLYPLDARLNLPDRKYSYLLQSWMSGRAVETSYESASAWLESFLGVEVAHRPIQRVVKDCEKTVDAFMDSLPAPPANEEGSILIHTADCKGVPMRPTDRNPAASPTDDKPGVKRMACITRSYSALPYERTPEGVVESFLKNRDAPPEKRAQSRRSKPCHRRTVVSLKREKSAVFDRSAPMAKARIHKGTETRAVLMDGERALWRLSSERFVDWTEIIDFSHVMEKLWIAGKLHFGESARQVESYVRQRALLLLQGQVAVVIEDLLISLGDGTLSPAKAEELTRKVVGYFQNNRHRMAYDEYLAKGLPIATGVIESTCKSLVNRRMEGPGMLWSSDGAEAMLKLRGVFIDQLWDDFQVFRAKQEKKRLYEPYSRIRKTEPDIMQLDKAA